MIEKIKELLNSEWTGKSFVYRSKYGGEVISEIDSVHVSYTYTWDKETNEKFRKLAILKKGGESHKIDVEKLNAENTFTAVRPKVSIRSSTGIYYDLDEIFIITHDSHL